MILRRNQSEKKNNEKEFDNYTKKQYKDTMKRDRIHTESEIYQNRLKSPTIVPKVNTKRRMVNKIHIKTISIKFYKEYFRKYKISA